MREFIKDMREGNYDRFAKIAATSGLPKGQNSLMQAIWILEL